MADEEKPKFYLERGGKRVEVNLEHLRNPHSLKPRTKEPVSSPLVLGGDHRPATQCKKPQKESQEDFGSDEKK
ncbi:LAFE_0D06678g1_1 [Lachancea fermentati]|uniref:LAFE_0D06678g1_1 n=1 Tax=Lachancea fermentati TaxID=4955 RepID=A0A1G4MBE3_LACFM|nr:LAFE_0D06678g1_1 [Lachancea fermentati]